MEWVHISASTHLYSSHTKSFELSKETFAWSEFWFGFFCVCVFFSCFFLGLVVWVVIDVWYLEYINTIWLQVTQVQYFECIYKVAFASAPSREAGDVGCHSPVWNLRAVIWFPFLISSLVFLPTPLALSVSSFVCWWSILLTFFKKILKYFSLKFRLFCMVLAEQLLRW